MRKGLSIALIIIAILAIAGFIGYKVLMSIFIQKYYRDTYLPEPLPEIVAGSYPAAYHLDDVPWIATQAPVCQSNSLQMIAAQHGIAAPRQHLDFLMGFTYGVDPAPCEPGNRPPGERGIYVPEARLLEAIARQAKEMRYRWRYALVIFESAETVTDLAPIWARNGAALRCIGNPIRRRSSGAFTTGQRAVPARKVSR